MKIQTFEFNPISENTYVVYDETKESIIIDPGCFFPEEKQTLWDFVKDNGLEVKRIINTHLHFDHVLGLNFATQQFKLPAEAHQGDEELLVQLKNQLQMFRFPDDGEPVPTIGRYLTESDTIEFGNQKFKIFHIPGHSQGSVAYYNEVSKVIFVGDIVFRGSVGRTDLPGGNHDLLISGIKSKLLTLPDETIVYPGHGEPTTIGAEKRRNPFLI